MARKKILIVDDSMTVIRSIQAQVKEKFAYTPYYATSFAQAKELIAQHDFFVAILDLELPDSASGELVDFAIANKIHSIVLTATFNEELRKQVLQKPIVDYIVKNSMEDIKHALSVAENLEVFDQKIVMIVDDSKLARMQIRFLCELLSLHVVEASSAQEALEKLSNSPQIDLITVDYEMPGMDGVAFTQKVRMMPHLVQPIVFAVSSNDTEFNKARFLKNGANDYFVKPVHKEEFNHKLGNYLKILSQREELVRSRRVIAEYNRALSIGGYVTKSDPHGMITFISEKLLTMTGYTYEEVMGKSHSIFRHPNTPKSVFEELWRTIKSKEIWSGVLKNSKKNGEPFYARTTIVPILNHQGDIVEYVAFRDDVSELIESEQKLLAYFKTDLLTSLGNRIKLLDDLETSSDSIIGLINIIGFKEINSEYGYRIGDSVLVEVGKILFDFVRKYPVQIYRLSGDEFAILATESSLEQMELICKEIEEKISSEAISVEDYTIEVLSKIGIASGNNEILLHADIALKQAKEDQKNNIVVYTDNIKASIEYKNQLHWKNKIAEGIKNDLFIPYYQPIVSNADRSIVKYEALIRLKEADNTVISPAKFLEISKRTRYYFELTMLMIRKTFERFSDDDHEFSLNFSVEDIRNDEVMHYFRTMLYDYSGIQKRLTIEIVESEGIEHFAEVTAFIRHIKEMGCKIAIDDFGTGYSNFEYLMQLDIDYIKIDGSLIRNIAVNEVHYSVVETIIQFARKNNIQTIAEYVSSEEIFERIQKLGIDFSQGYYFYEPQEELQF